MSSGNMNLNAFRKALWSYRTASGHSQEQLARAIGIHPKVLSRKLHGDSDSYLTHPEVKDIIKRLAEWQGITRRDEACHLLELAGLGQSAFSEEEWQKPPLSTLEAPRAHPMISSNSLPPVISSPHNLPARKGRLIGRGMDVGRLKSLLQDDNVRLVTLFGTGGSGKTRLALEVARELVDTFAQGVWLVSLAGVRDPSLVPISIMQALDIKSFTDAPPLQSLISRLKNRQLLLLLDNFEHIKEATFVIDELLAGVPGLKVLVTSRSVLHLYGEHTFSVSPLAIPDPDINLAPRELMHFGAVQLFVERARAVAPDFTLATENAPAVVKICARVDGLPLALELAAARVRVLSPAQLLELISPASLHILTKGAANLPNRQQTLRDTITWSYDLLSPAEQRWFNRLGIFTGGWSFKAVEAMMQALATEQEDKDILPLDLLERLLDNSLLVRMQVSNGDVRFTMLETLREYALEQLRDAGEFERLHDWHACYYLREAEAGELGLRGSRQLEWLERLTADRDNFRAVMAWGMQRASEGLRIGGNPCSGKRAPGSRTEVAGSKILSTRGDPYAGLSAVELCLRLAAASRACWEWQGYLPEVRGWLAVSLEATPEDVASETTRAALAKALGEAARIACFDNEPARALDLAERGIVLWRELDDPNGLIMGLFYRAWVGFTKSDYDMAESACREGLQYISAANDPWLHGQLLFYLATSIGIKGDHNQMWALHEQSRKLFEQVGDQSAIADILKDHGAAIMMTSDFDRAIKHLLESVEMSYRLRHKQFITTGMCWLSLAFGLREKPDPQQASIQSAKLEGAATALMEALDLSFWTRTHPFVQLLQQHIRSQVDEQTWQAAWEEGRSLTIEQIIDLIRRWAEGDYL
jgi:predicted ATPase/transcriptional regulator with XRE-family HTH domain